jgi:hypothetical protein
MKKLKSQLLPHPGHSLDLSPSDYHIFWLLEDVFGRQWFANDEEVKDVMHTWLHTQPKTFFADSFRRLTDWREEQLCEEARILCQKMTIYLFLCTLHRINKMINCSYFLNSSHMKDILEEAWRSWGKTPGSPSESKFNHWPDPHEHFFMQRLKPYLSEVYETKFALWFRVHVKPRVPCSDHHPINVADNTYVTGFPPLILKQMAMKVNKTISEGTNNKTNFLFQFSTLCIHVCEYKIHITLCLKLCCIETIHISWTHFSRKRFF